MQSNDDQRTFIINSINNHINDASAFALKCETEATRSSVNKRRGRWINGAFGSLIAILGVVITVIPDTDAAVRKSIGFVNALSGVIVATAAQFIDPAKSRKRAIDLKFLRIQLTNLVEDSQLQLLGLKCDDAEKDKLINLHKNLIDKFLELQKEAFDYGVDV